MRPNFWKILLTFPYYLNALRKARKWHNRIMRDESLVKEEKRYVWVQRIAMYLVWLHNIKIKMISVKNWLDGPVIIVPNHQSNLDGGLLFSINDFSLHAPCAFIAKSELKKSKRLYKFLSLIDVIFIDRDNLRQSANALNDANKIIKVPRSMVVFPEGTRNPSNTQLLDFKAGSFKIAQKAYVPIIPVTIYDSCNVLKGSRFRRKKVYIIFHKPIMPHTFMHIKTEFLCKKVQKIIQSGLDNIEEFKQIGEKEKQTQVRQKQEKKQEKRQYTRLGLFDKKKKKEKPIKKQTIKPESKKNKQEK